MKENWQNPEFRKKMGIAREIHKEKTIKAQLKGLFKRPTRIEQKYIELFKIYNVSLNYCGDGSLVIGFKNPDFVEANGKKLCVEVVNKNEKSVKRKGRKYYSWQEYEQQRIEHFEKYGWRCIVLWEDELKEPEKVIEKVKAFMLQPQ